MHLRIELDHDEGARRYRRAYGELAPAMLEIDLAAALKNALAPVGELRSIGGTAATTGSTGFYAVGDELTLTISTHGGQMTIATSGDTPPIDLESLLRDLVANRFDGG